LAAATPDASRTTLRKALADARLRLDVTLDRTRTARSQRSDP
jgi:hypothetical protein